MRANRKFLLRTDTRAEVGIGTLIVFIAMVLVAAVAASVLIGTAGSLESKASKTGTAATQQVASSLLIQKKFGTVVAGKIDKIHYFVSLAPGSNGVDAGAIQIRYTDGTSAPVFLTADGDVGTPGTPTEGSVYALRWHRNAAGATGTIMNGGDLVEFTIDLAAGGNLATGASADVTFFPKGGNPMKADIEVPHSLTGAYVEL